MTIHYRHLSESPALTKLVEDRKARLAKRHGYLERFEVIIRAPHQHSTHGAAFGCTVEVRTRGHHAVVSKHDDHSRHEDAYALVRDAFDAIEKQLDHALAGQRDHRV
ncbi:MAG: HPF/RaiA family ribosome-associated protein [Myxococcota bacterium]